MNPPLSATEDSASHGDAGNALLVAVTRLEAKLDVALAQHGAQIDEHGKDLADHETRIRALDETAQAAASRGREAVRRLNDHEDRVRGLEATPTVSPKALWAAVGSIIAAWAALTPLLERLYS